MNASVLKLFQERFSPDFKVGKVGVSMFVGVTIFVGVGVGDDWVIGFIGVSFGRLLNELAAKYELVIAEANAASEEADDSIGYFIIPPDS